MDMDSEGWIELAIAACNHANINHGAIETIATWDQEWCVNAVYRIGGGRYLKIYGPTNERQFHSERAVLRTLESQTAIPAPRILIEGERTSQPSYLVLTEIPGATEEHVWAGLERTEQLALAREFGTITAAIHRLPQEALAAVEQRFGCRDEHAQYWKNELITEIEAAGALSVKQLDHLRRFLHEEAQEYFDDQPKLTHNDLTHNHICLSQDAGMWQVTGIIDWGDAMIGPPEWDVAFLWFWTFSRDHDAMRECLRTLYADSPAPARFARRCMAASLYTPSMSQLWSYFTEREGGTESIEREMTAFLFPTDVFGPPD